MDDESKAPPADEDKAELEPKPASNTPDHAPPARAKVCNPNSRAADHGPGLKRHCCRASGFPSLYIVAECADDAEKLYRILHGLHYHAHIAVFIDVLED